VEGLNELVRQSTKKILILGYKINKESEVNVL